MMHQSILAFASTFACGVVISVGIRDGRSLSHLAFFLGMLILGLGNLFYGFALNSIEPAEVISWQTAELIAFSFLPGVWLFFSLTYARGNYREFLQKWKFALFLSFFAPLSQVLFFCDNMALAVSRWELHGEWMLRLGTCGVILHFMLLVSAVLVLMNLERTYRASVGTMRWRIKFMVLGLGVIFTMQAYTSSQVLLFHAVDLTLFIINCCALLVGCMLILFSLFRAGCIKLDIYPSHSLLRNSVTVLLAGVYLLIVGVFAKVVALLGGDDSFTLQAFLVLIALVLLSALLLSDRVRVYIRQFVSRHLQRPMYDYRDLWRRFIEGTIRCVKAPELCQAAIKLVADVFQALSVTIWMVDEKKQNLVFSASTFLSESRAKKLELGEILITELIAAFGGRSDPWDIDVTRADWAIALRRCHPDEFQKGGNRVCVPLIAGGEFLGVILLGDRVSGVPFSSQDLDLLKCLADQLAAGLLTIQLSQRLMQASEIEAFQTMSTFFIHDLKNTASTLSLMLQNMPKYHSDPAFLEDALRGIAKAVRHINEIIERLTLLRKETVLRLAEADLNELTAGVLDEQSMSSTIQIVREFGVLPKQALDAEQIRKVITNLVLNAKEAICGNGEIRVVTAQQSRWSVLSISDTGSGMSREFVQKSLFRPFQTTKKNGIGIGIFQCKLIVEAHGGKIEVETELGKGATFRVLLPLYK